ncbi:MBL fold metallo-hydrolase [Persicirhabdus sediminis]|uniref:MBL fold metallo-hydrolase n=1 Tax=Persicirhabdus sediminis TaxID=454144 RepID=A0A8J7SGN0_9BACT|nr:MBL fold metallo-hydrolase [Persicirhabdus sediminis]MBK1790215.1 MBL fold metallo-hydrolase [Persicirhabdus sediminis]
MEISVYTGGMVSTNAYLIEDGDICVLFDAPEGVAGWLQSKGKKPSHCYLTHQHFDHVEDVAALNEMGVTVLAYMERSEELVHQQLARTWGLPVNIRDYKIDQLLADTTNHDASGLPLEIFHVPGHSVDSIAFYHQGSATLIAGDTLFASGVGRSDLPGGNELTLFTSIKEKLYSLPDETSVYPGHGPRTTIGVEANGNPYVKK